MYRIVLLVLLFLAVPNLFAAEEAKPAAPTQGVTEVLIPNMPLWQRFVEVFAIALMVLIVFQLMMLRSDLNAMLERMGGVGGSGMPPVKR